MGAVLSFYSLLGVSFRFHYVHLQGTNHFQLTFYSLLGVSCKHMLASASKLLVSTFLLPFGSFNDVDSACWRRHCTSYLSTPFWEFPVSRRMQGGIRLFTAVLSTPFWEFLNVSTTVNPPNLDITLFLLPFGSFDKDISI